MKREFIYGFFAIIATLLASFVLFIFVRGQIASYIALLLSLLVIIAFTHFYFRKSHSVNVQHLVLSMVGTTIVLYVLIVAIIAGKGIDFLYSPPFWLTAIESIAIPFGYAKLAKRKTNNSDNSNNPNDPLNSSNSIDANNAANSNTVSNANNASNLFNKAE